MGKPKISILMPTYNREHTVIRALESVIVQTCTDWQVLIFDDGSTDNTVRVIQDWVAKLPQEYQNRFLLRKFKENSGQGVARHELIRFWQDNPTAWACWLDSDDWLHAQRLERQLEVAKKGKFDVVFSHLEFVFDGGRKPNAVRKINVKKYDPYNLMSINDNTSTATAFFNAKVGELVLNQPPINQGNWDGVWHWQIIRNNCKIGYLPEVTYYCWQHSGRIVRRYGSDAWKAEQPLISNTYHRITLETDKLHTKKQRGRRIVLMSVFNEAANLDKAIRSVYEYVDEIWVFDGAYVNFPHDKPYSTDGTDKICDEYAKVKYFKNKKPFADQMEKRNSMFVGNVGDTYLILDGDEYVVNAQDIIWHQPCDVGWLYTRSTSYKRAYVTPRLIRHREGLHYAGRHSWLYDNAGLVTSHQHKTKRLNHRTYDVYIYNERAKQKSQKFTSFYVERNGIENSIINENSVYKTTDELIPVEDRAPRESAKRMAKIGDCPNPEYSLVVPFSRFWAVDRWFKHFENVIIPAKTEALVIVDTQNDAFYNEVYARMSDFVRRGKFAQAKLLMTRNPQLPEARAGHLRRDRINENLYRFQTEIKGKIVLGAEDDTLPQINAYEILLRDLQEQKVDGVQATIVGRWQNGQVVPHWQINEATATIKSAIYEGKDLVPINGMGWYCFVMKADAFRAPKIRWQNTKPLPMGGDLCFGFDLVKLGYKLLGDWRVICDHFTQATTFNPLTTPVRQQTKTNGNYSYSQPQYAYLKKIKMTKEEKRKLDTKVSVLLVEFLRPDYTVRAINSLRKHYPEIQIILGEQVKDGENPNLELQTLLRKRDKYVRLPFDCGVTAARNELIKQTKRKYVLVADNDMKFTGDSKLTELVKFLEHNEEVDIIGGRVRENGQITEYQGWLDVTDETIHFTKVNTSDLELEVDKTSGLAWCKVDMLTNCWIGRREKLPQWDSAQKIYREHLDYFLELQKAKLNIAFTSNSVTEHRGKDVPNEEYRNKRYRINEHEFITRKWGKKLLERADSPKNVARQTGQGTAYHAKVRVEFMGRTFNPGDIVMIMPFYYKNKITGQILGSEVRMVEKHLELIDYPTRELLAKLMM